MTPKTKEFIDYVHKFYGPEGVYPMGATKEQITAAFKTLRSRGEGSIGYDSVDRERVRDILIEEHGLVWPTLPVCVIKSPLIAYE